MKVLVTGPYRDGTGYSHAAIEVIMSLLTTDVDVVCRSVKMTKSEGSVPSVIDELERKDIDNVDKIIQYNIPAAFCYNGSAENVGYFAYETQGMPINEWLSNIEKMDKIFVPCAQQAENLSNFVKNPDIYIVPHSVGELKPNDSKIELPIGKNTLKFYTISEFGKRKNLEAMILAYFSAFSSSDDVVLILKTHISGVKGNRAKQEVLNIINSIKEQSGKYGNDALYPQIVVTTDYISEDKLSQIHNYCDVFLSSSNGEGWGLPFIDALNHGNQAIIPDFGAFSDHKYLEGKGVEFIKGQMSPCFGGANELGVYSSNEQWFSPSVSDMAEKMFNVYMRYFPDEHKNTRQEYVKNNFNRETIGQQLKKALEA